MLTSFFSKSKPVNFLVVVLFMTMFYLLANVSSLFSSFDIAKFGVKLGIFLCFLLNVIILNFIGKKNDLSKYSSYKIVIFAVLAVSFSEILRDNQVIVANLCVLLSLRRVITLRSQKDIQKKIFDATFWVCVASLFNFWAILFLIVVYSGVLMHTANYFKNWLIPLVAIFTVSSLVTGYHLLINNEFYTLSAWFQQSNFDFELYGNIKLLLPLSIILALALWTSFFYIGLMQKSNINSRPTYVLVLLTMLVATLVGIFSPTKNGSELIFLFIPLAIITSNYFESKRERIFKEILLIGLILLPIYVYLFF
ncbi:DUF6427 family protein [Gillisia sp. M10.2A]|uniref:DUF6427 family protein n=1 Tax=Gillisia lutea TaxID=2909668 RepID=A0ABS9ECR1_9FLAO|nr:DUF6427 family protein [Gillisia lutea]MCF4100661.1 DUF6427 family protein [Gillisia lutea]